MKHLLIPILCLSLACCTNQPSTRASQSATPELLLQKFRTDPQNAYRYVNPTNANMVLRSDENYTILHAAAFQRNFPLVRALVENGANPGVKARWPYDSGGFSEYNRTPATEALSWRRTDIASYLTERSGENLEELIAEADEDARRGREAAIKDGLNLFGDAMKLDRALP